MHRNRLTLESGFRLIRALTPDHNAARLRKHVDRLRRRQKVDPLLQRLGIKRRREARAAR